MLSEQAAFWLCKGVDPNLIVGVIVWSVILVEPVVGGETCNNEKEVVVVSPVGGKSNCLTVKLTPLSGENVLLLSIFNDGFSKPDPVVYVRVSKPVVLL